MSDVRVKIWFDGGCPLCRREIALLRRLDRARRLDCRDLTAAETVCPLDRGTLLGRFHAQVGDGPLLDGAAAFAAVWRALPALALLGRVAQWGPCTRLLERAYGLFLRARPRLQRWAGGPGRPR
jgi:predicted DCC family thiol-disulfide oxidoreductase YuxK